jgi:hypothetical protein
MQPRHGLGPSRLPQLHAVTKNARLLAEAETIGAATIR